MNQILLLILFILSKGGEADHVVLYEKSCWPADLKSKIGLERSSEF